ncbi:MAG: insulinase family protein [Cyclobacteriaceae bacterium]
MKNTYILIALLFLSFSAFSQLDRSKKPEAAPAKEIKIGDYQKFELKNGLKVIVVENKKIPRVAFSLILDRDPLVEGDKVGYLSMVGQLMRSGTTNRTKSQLDEEVDFIGASLSASSSSIFGSSLTKHQNKLLDLMTDVLYNPSFPEDELDKIKKQTVSGLKSNQDDPNAISGNVRSRLLYGSNHPYGEIQLEEHVENISVQDIKDYYKTYFKPNIAYLAIVGDITVKDAKKIAKARFGKWERGDVPTVKYDQPSAPEKNIVALVNRSNSVQTVLNVNYPIDLKPGSPESIQARVMNQVLGGGSASRLFLNIRGDKGFTYGAYSSISSDELVGNFNASASVRTEVTDSSTVEFLYEMGRIGSEDVEEGELQQAKNVIIGGFGRSLERPQTIASFAISQERYNLDENYYNNYVKNIQAVTSQEVKEIANTYIKPENAFIVAVGKTSEFADKMAQFGEVKHYDIYGNEVDPSLAKLPEGLTAESVLNKYLDAVGGKENLAKLNSVKMNMEASMMGQTMQMEASKMAPNKSVMEVKMGGNVMQKIVFDGNKGKASGMAGTKMIEGDDALDLALTSSIFEEAVYLEKEMEIRLAGVETIEGNDAYGVEVISPSGKSVTRYYDSESGFLVRVTNTVDGPQGAMTLSTDFSDYVEYDGYFFPTKLKQPMNAQMKMDISVTEVIINAELPADLFKIE